MKNHKKIQLKTNAKFVRTCEVPELIADALHPSANYLKLPVIELYKIKKQDINNKKPKLLNLLSRNKSTSNLSDHWYEPLNQLDEDILRNEIWFHLPQLTFPISMDDWHKYGEAFASWESEINFELKPNRAEWTYEPAGDANSFCKLNRDARNKLGMWEDDLVSDENIAIQECGIAEFNHIKLLRDAIQRGEIEQLDPNSNIPSTTFLTYGKISFASLQKYVEQLQLSVSFLETEPDSSTTADATPGNTDAQNHPQGTPTSPINSAEPAQSTTENSPSDDWRVQARAIADECFEHDTNMNCRDSLKSYSARVMDKMQERGIKGPRGIIDNAGTIMREALQGAKWWANKTK